MMLFSLYFSLGRMIRHFCAPLVQLVTFTQCGVATQPTGCPNQLYEFALTRALS